MNQPTSPTIILSYKSRHEEIDNKLFEIFDKLGFEGEQASAQELYEPYLCEPIDIFILQRKDLQASIIFPKIDESICPSSEI